MKTCKKQHGKRPSPLQYFIASIGFACSAQFKRSPPSRKVALDDLELDLRMTCDLSGKFPIKDFSAAAQGTSYVATGRISRLTQLIVNRKARGKTSAVRRIRLFFSASIWLG